MEMVATDATRSNSSNAGGGDDGEAAARQLRREADLDRNMHQMLNNRACVLRVLFYSPVVCAVVDVNNCDCFSYLDRTMHLMLDNRA
jgi:hypothetical protein